MDSSFSSSEIVEEMTHRLREIESEMQDILEECDGQPSLDDMDNLAKLDSEAEIIKRQLNISLW